MKRVEEMMRELREVVAAPIDNYFYTLARHVLIRETKARIDTSANLPAAGGVAGCLECKPPAIGDA